MSATIVGAKRQTTLPAEVVEAAGIRENDQVDWRYEDGEIRGRKLEPIGDDDILDLEDLDPKTLVPKEGVITDESIMRAIRADRDAR